MMKEVNAISIIALRDLLKFLRDKPRIIISFIFPLLFIGILGGSLQANLGESAGYNFLAFTFTGVLAQVLFQSVASGVTYLMQDRENDFSQEIFVSPISRYSIIIGKIIGESLIAFVQAFGIIIFGLLFGVPLSFVQIIVLIPAMIIACLLGGAFGVLVLSNLNSQRSADQLFPLIFFPQFFLAGVFSPIKVLPWYLDILSKISPMRYAVDFLRGVYYWGSPEYDKIVLMDPLTNLAIIAAMFTAFLTLGTFLFVRNEKNR